MISMNAPRTLLFFLVCAVMATGAARAQSTYYVNDDGNPANGCTSWVDACPDLQTALGLAVAGDQIWVATGTYRPTPGTSRSASFELIPGAPLYGGFDGTETTLEERAGLFDQTILSGDLLNNDVAVPCTQDVPDCNSYGGLCVDGSCIVKNNNAENSRHVVFSVVSFEDRPTKITFDGFTITGGNATSRSAPYDTAMGGGMFVASLIGAVTADYPTIANCTFDGNSAGTAGGGLWLHLSTISLIMDELTVTNCIFTRNHCGDGLAVGETRLGGGGMYLENWMGGGNPEITNCTFSGNSSDACGGGAFLRVDICLDGTKIRMSNCTFSGNLARGGGVTAPPGIV